MHKLRFLPALVALASFGCAATAPPGPTSRDAMEMLARGDEEGAKRELDAIAHARVDTMDGAIAVDALAMLYGNQPFPERAYECSTTSIEAADRAETYFQTHRLPESEAAFDEALRGCPGNAQWWIHAGDVDFRTRRYETAREKYRRGLDIDPWNRSGHRYLSDAEILLGRREAAWDHLILAVISDPTYEAGWEYLKQATLAQGGKFYRQYEFRPTVWRDGDVVRVMHDPMEVLPEPSAWALYTPEKTTSDALRRRRNVVSSILDRYDPQSVPAAKRPSKMWPALAQARKEGFLDEAIFLHLLDAALVPEYIAFRDKHRDRLIEYIERFIAVLPGTTGSGAKSDTASLRKGASTTVESQRLASVL